MHDLIQAMAKGIVHEEFLMPGKQIRLWNLSDVYDLLSGKKVAITKAKAVEVLVLLLEKSSQKCFRMLKVMKLKYYCNLTTTPDFSKITNLEELSLEGWVNLVSVHPSIGILKRLVVLNLTNCKRLQIFPSLHMLKYLNLSYCHLEQVPESIGGLSCLEDLYLSRNNFTSLPGSLSQLSHLQRLDVDGYKKLEVLPKLPPNLDYMNACDCTSLREVLNGIRVNMQLLHDTG
ncbi:NB-ARC domains-containing protein [Tanacetum coccineum]